MKGLVLAVLAITQTGAPRVDDSVPVAVPFIVKKLFADHKVWSYSITDQKSGERVIAISDMDCRVRVAVSRDGAGEIFDVDLESPIPPRVHLADIDHDGFAELLVCERRLRIYRVMENGLKLLWASNELFGTEVAPRVLLSDFNNDGQDDIALLNYKKRDEVNTQSLYIYLRQTTPEPLFELSGGITFTDEHEYHSTSGLTIGNFLGDEQSEIVVGNDNGWLWLLRIEAGKPVVLNNWKVPSGGAVGWGVATGNLDQDAQQELLVGTNGGNILVYKFDVHGEPQIAATAEAGRLAYGVHAADLDGDGIDEFLLARGHLGYANMAEKDVVTEVYKLEQNRIKLIWRRAAIGFDYPRILMYDLNRDGMSDMLIDNRFTAGQKIEAINPVFAN